MNSMKCLECGNVWTRPVNYAASWFCPVCQETWLVCGEGLRRWNPGYNGWDVCEEGCMRVHGVLPGGPGAGLDSFRIDSEAWGRVLERVARLKARSSLVSRPGAGSLESRGR